MKASVLLCFALLLIAAVAQASGNVGYLTIVPSPVSTPAPAPAPNPSYAYYKEMPTYPNPKTDPSHKEL